MKEKILFLSHDPHPIHVDFAKIVDAKIKIIPFKNLVAFSKKFHILLC